MLVEQDRLSGDTVLWQNLGTTCQAPRRHLAIAIPFVPIYQISVQRDYNYYFLAFWKIQLDLLILCCHVLKAIAFIDDGGFLVLGYEISVC